jgi:hypothetical protein
MEDEEKIKIRIRSRSSSEELHRFWIPSHGVLSGQILMSDAKALSSVNMK